MVKTRTAIYTYTVDLPDGFNEAVLPCADGFTIYVSSKLDETQQRKAWVHAMKHIANGDFDGDNVQRLERQAHR